MSYSTMKRSLEIELISAEGLKANRKPVKGKTYCVVTIDQKSRVSPKLDEFGKNNPVWKDKFEMEILINGSVKYISIEVFYQTSNGSNKSVGYAKIPVTDFMGGLSPQGHLNFLSYRLRDEYGDKCGIVNLSIMVKPDKFSVATVGCSSQLSMAENGQMWRPKTSSSMAAMTAGYNGRIVTGVPVWFGKNDRSSGGWSTSTSS